MPNKDPDYISDLNLIRSGKGITLGPDSSNDEKRLFNGTGFQLKPASVAAKTTTTTLTAAEVVGGMITANQGAAGAATYTLPTGTLLAAAIDGLYVGASFDLTVTNISTNAAEDVTIAGGTGTTLVGSGVVASNAAATDRSAAIFRFVYTAENTFSVYRIA